MKGVDRLAHDLRRVADLARQCKGARFDTGDIQQVSDEAIHPSTQSLNALGIREHLLHVLFSRHLLPDEHGISDDSIEQIAQIVAHDPQELVPGREHIVGPSPFAQKVLVGSLAFGREKAGALSTFVTKRFIRLASLFPEGLVFLPSLLLEKSVRLLAGRTARRLSIRLRASRRKHIVSARPGPADNSVRCLIDGSELGGQSMIRSLAFDPQAFVRVVALETGLLLLGRHGQDEVYHRSRNVTGGLGLFS
jgi:hypothetical protein